VGEVTGRAVRLDTIVWPGGELVVAGLSARARSVFRIVTALAPPFVMEGELDEDGQCLRGLACHRVLTSDKDNLTLVFNEMETHERLEEEEEELRALSTLSHWLSQSSFSACDAAEFVCDDNGFGIPTSNFLQSEQILGLHKNFKMLLTTRLFSIYRKACSGSPSVI
jgi:hypothetical protein